MTEKKLPPHHTLEEMMAVITSPATYVRTRYSGQMVAVVHSQVDWPEHFQVEVTDSAGTKRSVEIWLQPADEERARRAGERGVAWSEAARAGIAAALAERGRGTKLRDECERDGGEIVIRTESPERSGR